MKCRKTSGHMQNMTNGGSVCENQIAAICSRVYATFPVAGNRQTRARAHLRKRDHHCECQLADTMQWHKWCTCQCILPCVILF